MPQKEKVLIAEDEKSLRVLYGTWVDEAGYQAIKAEDGPDALNKWTEDIDVVVLDRRMPDMYGDEVLSEARDDGLHTPVTMLTAVDPDLDVIDMAFDDYMEKPVEEPELVGTIEDLIHKSKTRSVVRDFVRIGIKISKLQKSHPESMLKTHDEYQELTAEYEKLRSEVSDISDDLDEYERKLLMKAKKTA